MPVISKSDLDVIVVGAGIIGSTIAKSLRSEGRDVTLIDDKRSLSGTRPSGGHLKPSWFGDLKKVDYEPAMDRLFNVWGDAATQSDFKIWPTGLTTTVYRIDTDVVVNEACTEDTVTEIIDRKSKPIVKTSSGKEWRCELVIVAAGVWCNELYPLITIQQKRGVSFRFRGKLEQEFIKPWAPFKQIVAHQQEENEIWIGDGSAILLKNWTLERTKDCLARCQASLGTAKKHLRTITGLRPYCDSGSDPCLLKQVERNLWIVTGAGKSGTISAGWASNKIISATN